MVASDWLQLLRRVRNKFWQVILPRALPVKRGVDLVRIGSTYGGWVVPKSVLRAGAVCYCAGLGEDGSFDLGLAETYGCSVFVFDPTPRAIAYAAAALAGVDGITFEPVGLWASSAVLRFFAPTDPSHVSHSIVNLQGTSEFFEAECDSVVGIMQRLGHDRLAILKLDIEGAEFAVLGSVLGTAADVDVICVEFDQPVAVARILRQLWQLKRAGYELLAVEGWNFALQSKLTINPQSGRTTARQ